MPNPTMNEERLSRIRPCMQAYIEQDQLTGISTMVAHKGQIVWNDQVGWQDKEQQIPLKADAIFRMYSMTKPVICTALMMLYEQGKFHLFHPIGQYLPAFQNLKVLEADPNGQRLVPAQREVTLRDLLTHTSGLTYDFLEDFPVGQLYRDAKLSYDGSRTLAAMMDELARQPLAFQPGTQWHYSLSIDVLAHLIEVLSGQPLGDFLQEQLFTPLGMTDTGFHVPAHKQSRCASMYGVLDLMGENVTLHEILAAWTTENRKKLDVSQTYPLDRPGQFARGGVGLYSTLADYMKFAQLLLNQGTWDGQQIVGRKTLELMHSNHLPAAFCPYHIANLVFWKGYGFGLGSRVLLDPAQSEMPGSVGEFGWAGAAKTYFWVDPQEELIGLFMSQHMMGLETPDKDFQVLTYQALC